MNKPVTGERLADHTTLKIGGPAAYFAVVDSEADIKEVKDFADEHGLPMLFLGGGSNLLVDDSGYAGVVLKNNIKGLEATEVGDEVLFRVGAGEVLDEVVAKTVEAGWWGMENLTSIPGTVGATPVQNVGAYGVEIGGLVHAVEAIDMQSGEKKIFSNSECVFGYRDSFFKSENGKNFFITHVTFKLSKKIKLNIDYADLKKVFGDSVPTQKEIREAVAEVRAAKFPDWRTLGTAGSFFKNPIIKKVEYEDLLLTYPLLPAYSVDEQMVKIPLGYVLDKLCDLKGYREGRVGLSEAQALVLINYGGASADEVKEFVAMVTKKVFEKTKIKIYPEVIFV